MVIIGKWRQLIVGLNVCRGIIKNVIDLENDRNDPLVNQNTDREINIIHEESSWENQVSLIPWLL